MFRKRTQPGMAEAFGSSISQAPNVDPRKLADQTHTLAILLEYAAKGCASEQSLRKKSAQLMKEFGNLGSILNANINRLQSEGLSQDDITLFKTVLGAQLHSLEVQVQSRDTISSWDQLLNYLHVACAYDDTEQSRVLFLDRKNRLIKDEEQARGTIDHVPVYPREIAKRALELNASAIILVHNHPSGDVTPSQADISMTDQIVDACKTIGVTVHDHIIVGQYSQPLSFKAKGHIP